MAFQAEVLAMTPEVAQNLANFPAAMDMFDCNVTVDPVPLSSIATGIPSSWRVTRVRINPTTSGLAATHYVGLSTYVTTPSSAAPAITFAGNTSHIMEGLDVDGLFHDPDDLYIWGDAAGGNLTLTVWIKPADGIA